MKKASKRELKEDKLVKSVLNLVIYIQEHSFISMVLAGALIVGIAVLWGLNYTQKKASEAAFDKLGVAQLAFRGGAFAEAKDSLRAVVEKYKSTKAARIALYYLAYLNYLDGNYDLAIENYERFLKKRIKFPDLEASALFGMGAAYEAKGDNKKAAEIYDKILSSYPDYFNMEEVLLALARVYKALGDSSKTLFYYEECLKKYPESMRKEEIKQAILELSLRKNNGERAR